MILDNLAAHKGKQVEELIHSKGVPAALFACLFSRLLPIEETFPKLKTYLRRAGVRTREALQEAICQALLTVTLQDAQGWFRHCGYLAAKEGT